MEKQVISSYLKQHPEVEFVESDQRFDSSLVEEVSGGLNLFESDFHDVLDCIVLPETTRVKVRLNGELIASTDNVKPQTVILRFNPGRAGIMWRIGSKGNRGDLDIFVQTRLSKSTFMQKALFRGKTYQPKLREKAREETRLTELKSRISFSVQNKPWIPATLIMTPREIPESESFPKMLNYFDSHPEAEYYDLTTTLDPKNVSSTEECYRVSIPAYNEIHSISFENVTRVEFRSDSNSQGQVVVSPEGPPRTVTFRFGGNKRLYNAVAYIDTNGLISDLVLGTTIKCRIRRDLSFPPSTEATVIFVDE